MADPKEQRIVVPATEAESIKANLQRVQEELARVRDKAREEADTLDRIRGMIDLKYLNDLLSAIDSLEGRVKAMEHDSQATAALEQLEKEQTRLTKLWDAFKAQEDELRQMENERNALLSRLEQMEDDFGELGSAAKVKATLDYLEKENKRLNDELRKAADRSDKYRDEFEEEQARLAKLYKVYEDMAEQVQAYQDTEAAWHAWRQKYWSTLPEAAKKAGDKLNKKTG
jgi:chromosome segregation ATPase